MKAITLLVVALVAASASASASPRISVAATHEHIEVSVERATPSQVRSLSLSVDGHARVGARSISERHDDQPIAIVVVLCTSAEWLDRLSLNRIENAFDGLAKTAPPRSTIQVIGYDATVAALMPRTEIAKFRPGPLGEIFNPALPRVRGHELFAALDVAIAQLAASGARRNLLVAFTDGRDSGVFQLDPAKLARRAEDLDLDLRAVVVRGETTPQIREVVPDAIEQRDFAVDGAVSHFLEGLPRHHLATFDAGSLPWDGRNHRFDLFAGNERIASANATLAATSIEPIDAQPPAPIVESWVAALVGGIGIAGIVGTAAIAIVFVRRRRKELLVR